jgi:L-ascorbate metabolism protein UlaG (beta-lactamase superfamily)
MTARRNGKRFLNDEVTHHRTLIEVMKWQRQRDPGPWRELRDVERFPAPPARVERGIRVTFVNHATVLLQVDGLNILTDPIWSNRCSPVPWVGPKRYRPPGVSFEDLPPIDLVLLSHNHYDHLDAPTLTRLRKAHQPPVYAGLGNRPVLERLGLRSHEMDWWQSIELRDGIRLTAVPARHFSGRSLRDRDQTLWMGFVLETPSGSIYFAGDTGWGDHFAQVHERFGPIDVALLPIGAYRPRWFMRRVHISPEEAVEAAAVMRARFCVPIHYGTFKLADDGQQEPVRDLRRALAAYPDFPGEFRVLDFGEGEDIPTADDVAAAG